MVGTRAVKGCTDKVKLYLVAKNSFPVKLSNRLVFAESGNILTLCMAVLNKTLPLPILFDRFLPIA
jgi:hypothetical protein